ncbi:MULTISPECIES: coproporphyrinogen III oxidase [Methylomonas]|uniref:coproporphyrinogen III oxidase n=1 Tax=Methylomonas TaxID=416 RepID=UPI001231F841|nr:coproporphyrinogen III oxidase [Methylomonas rhizoryzae]
MNRIKAKSPRAERAHTMVCGLQQRFVRRLDEIAIRFGAGQPFVPTEWLRDGGMHGGGVRYMATDEAVFNRASVNTSQVQYDDDAGKKLASASAISSIIHPRNPLAPSVHIHVSWTEMKDGGGYWRVMADLNPSHEDVADKERFAACLRLAAPAQYQAAATQGDRYFYIPVLGRHRGVTHFYLENYASGDFDSDLQMAERVGAAAIDTYCEILAAALETRIAPSEENRRRQLEYHTLYFFQVLTLDRGTTSGLLVHNQNDVGILASLPSHIDRRLLASWLDKMPPPQDRLLHNLLACLPESVVCPIEDDSKQALANCLRAHYSSHPEAIDMQASGNVIPPTVSNHR